MDEERSAQRAYQPTVTIVKAPSDESRSLGLRCLCCRRPAISRRPPGLWWVFRFEGRERPRTWAWCPDCDDHRKLEPALDKLSNSALLAGQQEAYEMYRELLLRAATRGPAETDPTPWICSCGYENTSVMCTKCGALR